MKNRICFLMTLVCALALLTACRRESPKPAEIPPAGTVRSDAEIISFSYRGSGSHISANFNYALDKNEDSDGYAAELHLNAGNIEHILPADASFADELQSIVQEHDLWKWNGFHKSAKGVLDGSGFGLNIVFADGSSIESSGDNRFPEGFSDANRDIKAVFEELMKKHGIKTDS